MTMKRQRGPCLREHSVESLKRGLKWTEDCCGEVSRKPSEAGLCLHSTSQSNHQPRWHLPTSLVCFWCNPARLTQVTLHQCKKQPYIYITWTCFCIARTTHKSLIYSSSRLFACLHPRKHVNSYNNVNRNLSSFHSWVELLCQNYPRHVNVGWPHQSVNKTKVQQLWYIADKEHFLNYLVRKYLWLLLVLKRIFLLFLLLVHSKLLIVVSTFTLNHLIMYSIL